MFNKAKAVIKEDACMKFHDESKLLYIETDHLELDEELHSYKQEAIQAVPEMKCQTIAYSDPLHSPART